MGVINEEQIGEYASLEVSPKNRQGTASKQKIVK